MATKTGPGRFQPGGPGGPGRPRRSVEVAYVAAMASVVSVQDWKDITTRAVKDAKAGDDKARAWLSRHLVGDESLALAELLDEFKQLQETVKDLAASRAQTNGHRNDNRPP